MKNYKICSVNECYKGNRETQMCVSMSRKEDMFEQS